MSKATDFLSGMQEMGKFISDKFYLTFLKDVPDTYENYSGQYLVVNDNESGIHFTGIEKIAQDLTDYEFLNFQTKYLTTSHTSNSVINDLSFDNLAIGTTYRMSSTLSFVQDATEAPQVSFYHDGSKINEVFSSFVQNNSNSTSLLFNATSNELTISGANLDSNNYIGGNVDDYISFVQVESLSTQKL